MNQALARPMGYAPMYPGASMAPYTVAQPAAYPVPMGYPTGGSAYLPAQLPMAQMPMAQMPMAQMPMARGPQEESYIENILRFNHGKVGTFYFTYQGNGKWNAMVYRGRVETAGRDHIIISDPETNKRYLLLMSNLDWVEFDEKINYPFPTVSAQVQSTLSTTD